MDVHVTAHTVLGDSVNYDEVRRVGGMHAGICYSESPFFEKLAIEPEATSIGRYNRTAIGTKHFSVGHNYQITVLLEGVSKMFAILMNSFTFYNTCERSGRYTNMSNGNPAYDKWKVIFEQLIREAYPSMQQIQVTKLAMENARYTLPLFNKMTTMAYTTSFAQFNFICGFFNKFIADYEAGNRYLETYHNDEIAIQRLEGFYENIIAEMKDFIQAMTDLGIYDGKHLDNKGRKISLFENKKHMSAFDVGSEVCGHMYETINVMTYPILADLIRHRTTNLSIIAFGPTATAGLRSFAGDRFYTPHIFDTIKDEALKAKMIEDWADTMSTPSTVLQGHLVKVRECGTLENFVLKAKERLCGRVQHEAMEVMCERIQDLASDAGPKVYSNRYAYDTLSEIIDIPTRKIKTKCEILGTCVEPCFFSGKQALDRNV